MPTYEYKCRTCQTRLEVFFQHPDLARRVVQCPHCKVDTADRQISKGGGVIFKGPGFHVNDYPKESS